MAYVLDLTASLAANYVETTYTRPQEGVWIFAMAGGAFFTKDLIVRNTFNGQELEPLTQYRSLHTVSQAVLESGKEVNAIIVITDNTINQITVKRRIVGGPVYSTIGSDVLATIDEAKLNALDSTTWGQVIGKPVQYPPALHTHYEQDVYGFEAAVFMLNKIKDAISYGDDGVFGMFYQYINRQVTAMNTKIDTTIATLQQEVNNLRSSGRFKQYDIVILANNVNPRDHYGYGQWRRLPSGLFMMTSDPAKVGTIKKVGEGIDYVARNYAAWEFLSE